MDSPLPEQLLDERLRQAFGSGCRLLSSQRMGGGTRKQVSRLDLNSPFAPVVLLVWHNEHDYFNEQADPQRTLSDTVAPKLYSANTRLLLEHRVRVPEIYVFDDTRSLLPYAFALVELVKGMSFNQYRAAHPGEDLRPRLEQMKEYLLRLHSIQRGGWGTVLDKAPQTEDYPAETLKETLPDLRDECTKGSHILAPVFHPFGYTKGVSVRP